MENSYLFTKKYETSLKRRTLNGIYKFLDLKNTHTHWMMIPKSQILTKKKDLYLLGLMEVRAALLLKLQALSASPFFKELLLKTYEAIFWISVGSYKLHLAESDRSGKLKLEKRYQDVACGP